jgi:predicted nucleic acid-binding Zn ribbon protein
MDIVTKQDAKARGLTRYFTGRPCQYDHVAERLTSSGVCVICMRERSNARRKTRAWKDRRNARLIVKRAEVRKLKPCIICETPFDIMIGGRTSAKTCSAKCSEIFYRHRKEPDAECEQCFQMFASRNPSQKVCSQRCRDAFNAEQRVIHTKTCLQCDEVFTVVDNRIAFCSDECRTKQLAKRTRRSRAAQHQKMRLFEPEKLRARKKNYKIVNAEAHKRTTDRINARRVAGETAAYEVAKTMIPDMLAQYGNYRSKVNRSVEFLRSIGIDPSKPMEKTDVPFRQAQSRLDHSVDQE